MPDELRELLKEVYIAIHNDSRRLALMGTRTLIEILMVKEIGDSGTFGQKLDALREKGVISENGRSVLSIALDAGNAAAHRGYKPNREEMEAVLDIVENLLEATHHLKHVAEELRKKIPPRPGQ